MPLVIDNENRGPHSYHVDPHRKLGKHYTVIRAMWDVINELIDRPDVKHVELGRIHARPDVVRAFKRRGIEARQEGRDIVMTCVAPDAVQFITATLYVGTDLQVLCRELMDQGFAWKSATSRAAA